MNEKDWLDELRVGDQICYHDRYHGYVFETIEKITPTKQIKTRNNTFKDGYCRSSNAWDGGKRLQPITRKILDEVRRKELLEEVRKFKFETLDLTELSKVVAVLIDIEFAQSAPKATESPSHKVTEAEAFGNDCPNNSCS